VKVVEFTSSKCLLTNLYSRAFHPIVLWQFRISQVLCMFPV
jgi:hypothetical protein